MFYPDKVGPMQLRVRSVPKILVNEHKMPKKQQNLLLLSPILQYVFIVLCLFYEKPSLY